MLYTLPFLHMKKNTADMEKIIKDLNPYFEEGDKANSQLKIIEVSYSVDDRNKYTDAFFKIESKNEYEAREFLKKILN